MTFCIPLDCGIVAPKKSNVDRLQEAFSKHPYVVFRKDGKSFPVTSYRFINGGNKNLRNPVLRIYCNKKVISINRYTINNGYFQVHFVFHDLGQGRLMFFDIKEADLT